MRPELEKLLVNWSKAVTDFAEKKKAESSAMLLRANVEAYLDNLEKELQKLGAVNDKRRERFVRIAVDGVGPFVIHLNWIDGKTSARIVEIEDKL